MTYTYALLKVSKTTYDEIREKLLAAGYQHSIGEPRGDSERIDMHGIALVTDAVEEGS